MTPLFSVLIVAAALGQAQAPAPRAGAEIELLSVLPQDVPFVIRTGALYRVMDELDQMLKAAGPAFAGDVKKATDAARAQADASKAALPLDQPGLFVFEVPKNEDDPPPFAIIMPGANFREFYKAILLDPDAQAPRSAGAIVPVEENPLVGGGGFVAENPARRYCVFSNDRALIAKILKGGKGIDPQAIANMKQGDVSGYANVEAINQVAGERFEQMRKDFEQSVVDAPGAAGQSAQAKEAFKMVSNFLKTGKWVTVNIDLGGNRLVLSMETTAKQPMRTKVSTPVNLAALDRMPAGMTFYIANSGSNNTQLESLATSLISGNFGVDFLATISDLGARSKTGAPTEILTAGHFGPRGMRGVTTVKTADAAGLLNAYLDSEGNAKPSAPGVKSVRVAPAGEAQTHRNLAFRPVTIQLDMEKLIAQQGPEMTGRMKAGYRKLLNNGTIVSWYAADPRAGAIYQVNASTFTDAKTLFDQAMSGQNSVGVRAGYKELQPYLRSAGLAMAVSAQGVLDVFSTLYGVAAPPNLRKEPVFVGLAGVAKTDGVRLTVIIPTSIGEVIENGFIPVFQKIFN